MSREHRLTNRPRLNIAELRPPVTPMRYPVSERPNTATFQGTQRTPEVVRGLSQYVSTITAQASRTPWPDAPGRKVYGDSRQPLTDNGPSLSGWLAIIATIAAVVGLAGAYIPKKEAPASERAIYSLDTGAKK